MKNNFFPKKTLFSTPGINKTIFVEFKEFKKLSKAYKKTIKQKMQVETQIVNDYQRFVDSSLKIKR